MPDLHGRLSCERLGSFRTTEVAEVWIEEASAGACEQVAAELRPLWPRGQGDQDLVSLRRAGEEHLSRVWEQIREAVGRAGAAVVHDVPVGADAFLAALTMALGVPSSVGNGDALIHDVRPRPLEEQGDVSATTEEFVLHTDSTALVEPHDFVCLACSHSEADAGGESLVLHVESLLSAMRDADRGAHFEALEAPVFPFPLNDPIRGVGIQEVPILARVNGEYTIRYRADTLAMGLAATQPGKLSEAQQEAHASLEEFLTGAPPLASFLLRPGDALMVDNRRVLHGRTAIQRGANRHLRRLKIFSGAPARAVGGAALAPLP